MLPKLPEIIECVPDNTDEATEQLHFGSSDQDSRKKLEALVEKFNAAHGNKVDEDDSSDRWLQRPSGF
jgi:hypothetical protein